MISKESREAIREMRKKPAFGADGFDLEQLRQIMAQRREPTSKTVRCVPWELEEIRGHWVLAEGADPDVRLLYLHGGGYVSGSGAFYLSLAARLSAAARCVILLPDYRLAPEHPFPAGLEDCICAYEWLRTSGPAGPAPAEAVFVAGDSAGGGLMLALLVALRDRRRPLPTAGIPISPFADLTLSGESIRSEAQLDPVQHPRSLPEYVSRYLAGGDARRPLASPVFGDYTGIPPLLIQVGDHEIIRDDSVRAATKAKADGVEATLEVWPSMFHVFQGYEPPLPEGQQAIEHIANFMRSHVAR